MPSLSVVHTVPSRRRNDAPADSSPPKPTEPSSSPGTNHLKPTGTSHSRRPSDVGDAVDHRRRHERLADRRVGTPAVAGAVEVGDGDGEEVVGVHQAVGRHDAVAVAVGVVAGRDVERRPLVDQRGHRVRRRAVHADLAVPVERHEAPRRIDERVDDREVEAVALGDRGPVVDARAAERVGADVHAGGADGVEVDDVRQVVDVRAEEVVRLGRGAGAGERHPPHAAAAGRQQLVGPRRDPARGVGVGRAAVWRVVLEAAVGRAGCATA